MSAPSPSSSLRDALHQVVSYLNFSSGTSDPKTLAGWDRLFADAAAGEPLAGPPAWLVIRQWLEETAADLAEASNRPGHYEQAFRMIRLIFSKALPAYLDRHKDLLFHQPPEQIFTGFFIGRVAERVLQALPQHPAGAEPQQPEGDEPQRPDGSEPGGTGVPSPDRQIIAEALSRLDDYVGYRPLPLLDKAPGMPYPGEWVRPVPLYITGAGVTSGPYCEIVTRALEALRGTDPAILQAASFDPQRLAELSFDPRAYDFDHPVHRRANFIFGEWDPHHIDSQGRYDRYVVRQVVLVALLDRVREDCGPEMSAEELLEEAAGVLAGTILMGCGISGWGPTAYSSDVTLKSLMDPIATYRDEFYHDLIGRLSTRHQQRLRKEMRIRRQPFGAARQHLNASLAQLRAKQLQHVQLARIYARMGYPDAAQKQADAVPVTSARLMCRIDCLMSGGLRSLRAGDLAAASLIPEQVFGLLLRAVDCGACVDPWNILYFAGNFSLFPGPEHSVQDHRVDDLVQLVEQHFGYMARVWSEAAARDDEAVDSRIDRQFELASKWWRKYAAHTVEAVEAVDPAESYESAKRVARALRLWHRGGAAAGDIGFWAPHAELFDSPRAYALVIGSLLDRRDFVASMALLIHWLENAPRIGLRLGGSSLPLLAVRWLVRLRAAAGIGTDDTAVIACPVGAAEEESVSPDRAWALARKFLDYLEANAESFWAAPTFALVKPRREPRDWDAELTASGSRDDGDEPAGPDDPDEDPESQDLFRAAYEDVVYQDTTDDGHEGAVFGATGSEAEQSRDDLEAESKRLVEHLIFLESLARMWAIAADIGHAGGAELGAAAKPPATQADPQPDGDDPVSDATPAPRDLLGQERFEQRLAAFTGWTTRAAENRQGLLELLDAVRGYRVAPQGSDNDAMRDYDRRRMLRDTLLERIIGTAVEMSDARRILTGVLLAYRQRHPDLAGEPTDSIPAMGTDDAVAVQMFAALIAGDHDSARRQFPATLASLRKASLLYIPLSRGGDPVKIFATRLRQRMLHHLLHRMPRRGLFVEACRLVEAARLMEQHNPIGMGAVTEFDGLFRIGFRSLVTSLVATVRAWPESDSGNRTQELISMLESLTETMLSSWLAHSQTLRLSSLELVADDRSWEQLVSFIRRYGDPLFTQGFLKLSNVRAILHQGVGHWIETVLRSEQEVSSIALFEDIVAGDLSRAEAEKWLSLVFESILDHHAEFLDYNSTTTQSDRGDLIYMFHDFLRLRVRYDRVAWNLKPVFLAHEILVRNRLDSAADIWRHSLSERIGGKAEVYVGKLRELQREYAMRMPTVADRILERFVQPMTIDRMRSLVEPATRDAEANLPSEAFDLLEREASLLTQHPTGVGIDMPVWLAALDEETEMVAKRQGGNEVDVMSLVTMPIRPLGRDDLQAQLALARRQGRRLPFMGH
ncbi:MAG: hypothetical protein EA381_05310 [Planctomycetaceae bacterium]|nr:MAG: hypothetical protein EA381_05310 [Planctomycetaceae bacterium]